MPDGGVIRRRGSSTQRTFESVLAFSGGRGGEPCAWARAGDVEHFYGVEEAAVQPGIVGETRLPGRGTHAPGGVEVKGETVRCDVALAVVDDRVRRAQLGD
ncbi:hypothetical protein C0993_010696, partial [Termitomyces sp. T159_Od127]